MARFSRICAVCALALGATLPAPARAQPASEIAAAKQWFTEGIAFEEKGDFAQALERFQRALQVKKTPPIQFHVGLCQARTGALVEGLVSLERASELAKAEHNQQVEDAAAGELANLRPRVPMLEVSVTGEGKPTSLSLDGVAISTAVLDAPIPVNPGKHQLVAEFDTGKVTRTFQAVESGRAKVSLEAPGGSAKTAPPPPAPAPPMTPGKPTPEPARDRPAEKSTSIVPWVLVGTGVVATLGGFYMWKLRGDQKSQLDDLCDTRTTCPADSASEVDDLESKGKTYNTLAFGFWGLGAAALATGGYLLLSSGGSEQSATRVGPAVGPGFAAAYVGGRF